MNDQSIGHIGLNKTGSSSIQKWLETSARLLREQRVLYEPLRQNKRYKGNIHAELCASISHHIGQLCPSASVRHTLRIKNLDDQAQIAASFVPSLEALVRGSPKDSSVVLSSEYLPACVKTPEKAYQLRDFMERFFENVEIIVYIRRQEDFIRSHWSQLAKYAPLKSLEAYIDQNPVRDYAATLAPFEKAFGVENITVRLAFPDILSGKSLTGDFREVLKIASGADPTDIHENISPSAAALELLRTFTRHNPSHFANGYMNPRYREYFAAVSAKDTKYTSLNLTKAQVEKVREANLEGNERIRERYFPDRPELFPQVRDYPDSIDLLPEVTALSAEVADHLLNRPVRTSGYRYFRDLFEKFAQSCRTVPGR